MLFIYPGHELNQNVVSGNEIIITIAWYIPPSYLHTWWNHGIYSGKKLLDYIIDKYFVLRFGFTLLLLEYI